VDRHVIVMLIVVGKMAYVRDFLPGMTVMTLMTVNCGLFLKHATIDQIGPPPSSGRWATLWGDTP
jgi:hypothetical protein